MKNFGLIYKVTNTINNKSYIDQTTLGLRHEAHVELSDGRDLATLLKENDFEKLNFYNVD